MNTGELIQTLYNLVIEMLKGIDVLIKWLVEKQTFGGLIIQEWVVIAPFQFKPIEFATIGIGLLLTLWIVKETVPLA